MNEIPKIDTANAQPANGIDPAEWATRVDLAACYRLVDLYGMTDLHLNHISARVPGNDEHFLINPFGKTKAARRKIPLTSRVKEVLERRLADSKSDLIFETETTGKPITTLKTAHAGTLRRSKVDHFRLYDLRHTFATVFWKRVAILSRFKRSLVTLVLIW